MTAQVVFVGVATLDALALVPHYPAANERVVATAISYAGGGPAATAAVAAARQGVAAAFVGAVGADPAGRTVLDGLRAEGVDVSGVTVTDAAPTGQSVVVVDHSTASRAISNLPAPAPVLSGQATELIGAAEWVHADHVGWPALAPLLPDRRWKLSVDAGYAVPGVSVSGVDLYVPTTESLASRHHLTVTDVDALLDAALAEGARTVVATAGAAGSYAATRDGQRYRAVSAAAEIVSTLGAGDVFHGALVAAYTLGMALPEALPYANTVAALSCRALDGRSAIPDRATTHAALALSRSHPDPRRHL